MQNDSRPEPQRRSAAHLKAPPKLGLAASSSLATANAQPEPPRVSAANLTVPMRKLAVEAVDVVPEARPQLREGATYDRLRAVVAAFGQKPNKNELVTALIDVCVADGIGTESKIIGFLYRVGFNSRHVAVMLKQGTGTDRARHLWRKGEGGRLSQLA